MLVSYPFKHREGSDIVARPEETVASTEHGTDPSGPDRLKIGTCNLIEVGVLHEKQNDGMPRVLKSG